MPKVVVTAEVENTAKWEEGLRARGDLLKSASVTNAILAANEHNEVAVCFDVTDVSKYLEVLGSPAVAEAMAQDGVRRQTVKVYVMDKEFQP